MNIFLVIKKAQVYLQFLVEILIPNSQTFLQLNLIPKWPKNYEKLNIQVISR